MSKKSIIEYILDTTYRYEDSGLDWVDSIYDLVRRQSNARYRWDEDYDLESDLQSLTIEVLSAINRIVEGYEALEVALEKERKAEEAMM